MAVDGKVVEVVVCLGSSCFARGNAQNLAAIEAYVANRKLGNAVRLTGCLCQDECKAGPNVMVGGEHRHDVSGSRLRELLQGLSEVEGAHISGR
jgi:NADH:ubiquinone oxidoreductase subunit E